MTFEELGLSEKVLQAVAASGYTQPTPIQAQSIPHALKGRDILGIAQTGTGKTAAFTLPMLSRLETGRARARMPRTLILEPTRELAAQVEENFEKYGVNHKLNVALLIGGVSFGDQEAKIMRGADVLIATPGRLLDFVDRGKLLLTGIDILVIDEADRMLDMGFIPDIERICKLVPFTRQTLFFSATMPPEITRLTETFLQNPVRVEVSRPSSASENITQGLVASHGGGSKRETLRQLLRKAENFKNAIIFCNRKRDVAILHKSLTKHGFSAGALHGDMDQRARMISLEAFKTGEVSLLVCSDVAARGLDIPDVSHVFNFDIPTHSEDYVHRIGRTGRAGKSGTALTIVTRGDEKYLSDIEKLTHKKIDWLEGHAFADLSADGGEEDGERAHRSSRNRRGERGSGERSRGSERNGDRPQRERGSSDQRRERAPRHARSEDQRADISAQPSDEGLAAVSAGAERPARRERPMANDYAPRQDRNFPREPRHYRHDDNDPPVVGLGDHVPSFLLRPVVVKSAKPKTESAEQKAGVSEE